MLLQDSDPTPPMLPVEVRYQAIPRVGGPRAYGEGAGVLLRRPREARIVYLGLVYCLADRQPNTVDFWISHAHAAAVCRHGACYELHSIIQAL